MSLTPNGERDVITTITSEELRKALKIAMLEIFSETAVDALFPNLCACLEDSFKWFKFTKFCDMNKQGD